VTKEVVRFVSAQTIILQSHFLEERVRKLEDEFREKFNGVSLLVSKLESSSSCKFSKGFAHRVADAPKWIHQPTFLVGMA
jgi:hypothetical protein